MSGYIKRADAIRSIADHDEFKGERWIKEAWADYLIEDAKPADVAPVRHGCWQITDAYPHNVYCSECHTKYAQTHWEVWEDGSLPRRYCPCCGAKMDEEVD